MSEPLLSLSEGLYLAEKFESPLPVKYELKECGTLSFRFSRPLRLPVFGRCGPLSDVSFEIEQRDLLGVERQAAGDQASSAGAHAHARILYADREKQLRRTPFFYGSGLDDLATHIESVCAPQRRKLLIIVNPKSGQGNSKQLVEREAVPILRAAGADVEVILTQRSKHATDIVRQKSDLLSYDALLSAGGDGTFHEVLAGLLSRDDWREARRLTLLQIPCGSGNALAASSGHRTVSRAAYAAVRGTRAPLDVATIIQPSTGTRVFSFLSITFGLIANLDIGTEHLRWMGAQRFVWGAIREILAQRTYRADVSFLTAKDDNDGDEEDRMASTSRYPELRALGPLLDVNESVLPDGERRLDTSVWDHVDDGDGFQLFSMSNLPWLDMNFHLHPEAASGSYNFVYATGRNGVVKGFELMTAAEKGEHVEFSWVEQRQITAFAVRPVAEDSWLVVDGEAIDCSPIFGEVHRGLVHRFV